MSVTCEDHERAFVPTDAAARKALPIYSGVLKYFPDALLAVADVSKRGNDQHNPGQPLHWAKEKSADEADALLRHLVDAGAFDADGVRHSAKVAWRALALLQREIDAARGVAVAPDSAWRPWPGTIGALIPTEPPPRHSAHARAGVDGLI